MKSDTLGLQANSTGSPKESPQWRRVGIDRSPSPVETVVEDSLVADAWSRTRIRGAQVSATVVYRSADARREAVLRRLREVLNS